MGQPEAKFTIRASDKTKSAFKSVNGNLKKVSGTVLSLKTAVVGLAGVGGFGALAVSAANTADALAKNADKLRVSTESLAGLHLATKLYTGVGAPAMNEALTKATKRLGEFNATGGGAAATWLKTLNLDSQELATLAPDQLFARYSEEISKLNDRGQQMAAISALMGDESRQLIGIIDAGSNAIEESTQKAIAYGTAISRVDAAQIEAANDAFTEVQEVIKGVGTTIAVELSPYIQAAAQQFAKSAQEGGGWKDEILEGLESVAMGTAYVIDVFRGLEVVWKGLEVTFAMFAEGLWQGLRFVANGIRDIANIIPGIDVSKFEFLDATAAAASRRTAELKQELENVATTPMPSDTVKTFFDEVKAGAAIAAAEVAKVSGGVTGEGDQSGGNEQATAEMLKQQEMLTQKLEAVNQYLMSEAELEQMAYENRLSIVEENFLNELMSAEARTSVLQKLELKHQKRMSDIEYRGADQRFKFAIAFRRGDLMNALASGAQLTQGVAQQNKTMFKINKAFSLAQAAISLPSAVMQSFEKGGGYPWGLIPAGLMLATGLSQINAIRSSSYGGGFSAPSLAGQGGGSGTINTVPVGGSSGSGFDSNALSPSRSEAKTETRTLIIKDDNPDRLMTNKQARQMYEEIEEARQEMGSNTAVIFA